MKKVCRIVTLQAATFLILHAAFFRLNRGKARARVSDGRLLRGWWGLHRDSAGKATLSGQSPE